jgi:hypothetical protein
MIYPHLGGKLPSVLRPGKGRHLSDLIVNVPTLIILAALVYAASLLAHGKAASEYVSYSPSMLDAPSYGVRTGFVQHGLSGLAMP